MKATTSRLFPVLLIATWMIALGFVIVLPYAIALSDPADFLIRNTVRVALAFWTFAVVLMLGGPRLASGSEARLAWTLACVAYLIHVGMAFHYAHHWSHAEAFAHVEQVGGFGAGIYVNYLFTLVWTVDVAWWWIDRGEYEKRPRWLGWTIHCFMIFMIVNGAIVFANGAIRWIGLAVLIGLGWLSCRRMIRDRNAVGI